MFMCQKGSMLTFKMLRKWLHAWKMTTKIPRAMVESFSIAPPVRMKNCNILLSTLCNEPQLEDQAHKGKCLAQKQSTQRGQYVPTKTQTCRHRMVHSLRLRGKHQDHGKGQPAMPWPWLIDFLLKIKQEEFTERMAMQILQIPE